MKYLLLSSLLAAKYALAYQVGPPPPAGGNLRNKNPRHYLRDFQAQELRLQLDAMKDARIRVTDVEHHRRRELERFASKLCAYDSPVEASQVSNHLVDTKWRLAFSSDQQVLDQWHNQAQSIHLEFQDESLVHYIVNLGKRMLPVQRRLQSNTQSNKNNGGASVVFTNQADQKDALESMHDSAIAKMGFLKTCKAGIDTAYFDGDVWIEQSLCTVTGKEYSNIYLRETEDL